MYGVKDVSSNDSSSWFRREKVLFSAHIARTPCGGSSGKCRLRSSYQARDHPFFFLSLHFIRAAGNYIVPRRASPLVGTSAVGSVVSVLHGGLRVCRSFLAGCSRGWLVQCKVRCATLAARSRSAEALGVFLLLSPRCPTLHSSPTPDGGNHDKDK